MDIGYGEQGVEADIRTETEMGGGTAEGRLDAAMRQLAAMRRHFELSPDPSFLADGSLRILDCNPAFRRLVGRELRPEEGLEALFAGAEGDAFVSELRASLARSGFWEGEAPRRIAGTGPKPERLTLAAVREPAAAAYVGIIRDVSELRRAEARLAYTENHDALTGLPNRQQYLSFLDALLTSRAASSGATAGTTDPATAGPVAACVLDLDEFKRFNNDATREVGDDLLRAVAGRLSEAVRQADLLARTGGDEFSLCFSLKEAAEVRDIADRVLAIFGEPFHVRGRLFHLRASMGIALGPAHGADASSLAAAADLALQAKKAGDKRGYELYSEGLCELLVGSAELEGELRQAIAAGMIAVHYQPIVRLSTGRIEGVEALARWSRPGRGPVPPSRFIPAAEETGLIMDLSARVFETACAWRSRLGLERGLPLRVSINVSARQLQEPGFAERTARRLRAFGLSPDLVIVEITESGLLGDLAEAGRIVEEIRSTGAKVLVDDFGVGFASLSYLKCLPVNGVKIDRSFVSDIDSNPHSRGIVEAVAFLARELGIVTVAEGVETEAQLEAVREIGCDYVQGYIVGKAMPAPEADAFIGRDALWRP